MRVIGSQCRPFVGARSFVGPEGVVVPEGVNVEVAHKLTEHEAAVARHERWLDKFFTKNLA
jgi:hypothetical protein